MVYQMAVWVRIMNVHHMMVICLLMGSVVWRRQEVFGFRGGTRLFRFLLARLRKSFNCFLKDMKLLNIVDRRWHVIRYECAILVGVSMALMRVLNLILLNRFIHMDHISHLISFLKSLWNVQRRLFS